MQSTSEYRQSTSCTLKTGGFYDTYCCNGINFRSIFIVKILKVQFKSICNKNILRGNVKTDE